MENDELLHKWVNGDLTAEEQQMFSQRPEYADLAKLAAETDKLAAPTFAEEEMLASILAQSKQQSAKVMDGRTRFRRSWLTYSAAAAVLLLLVSLFLWSGPQASHYQAAQGEQLEGSLPDGSTFVLNAGSALSFVSYDWDENRELHLEGEAFFAVEKGRTFQVQTPNGRVEVLGTKFNVWSREQTLEVKCQTGKVGVFSAGNSTASLLSSGDAVRYQAGALVEEWQEPAANVNSWTTGLSRFRKVPLTIVLDALERQFELQIDAREVDATQLVSCSFPHDQLETALKTSLSALGIQYDLSENRVRLFTK